MYVREENEKWRKKFFLSTIDPAAGKLAAAAGFGLEIAEYCTAWNMDEKFAEVDPLVRESLEGIACCVLHGPFNELFPCAIDPRARELAAYRFRQAVELAKTYGAKKVIFHGGYNPRIYYPVWYTEQSILFWKEFLKEDPGVEIMLENVLEEEPGMILDIVKGVDSPQFKLCLDVGHVNAWAQVPVMEWLEICGPWIGHFHIHNNDGSWDTHSPLDCGTIPMEEFLKRAQRECPEATFTLELPEAESSVRWLEKNG